MSRRLRADLPFGRIAVVLSGGGALAAYETGVLRTLERVGLKPSIVSGASAGALNAVGWVAQGFRTAGLERVWRNVDPAEIGMRWTTVALRAAGGLFIVLGFLQAIVSWTGSSDLSVLSVFHYNSQPIGPWPTSSFLDILAWLLVAAGGFMLLRSSREAEEWLARFGDPESEGRIRMWGAVVLLFWSLAHLFTWLYALPWPHRFSATLLAVTAGIWVTLRSRRAGAWARNALFMLMPETDGRGIWGSAARRHLVSRLTGKGGLARLCSDTHIILSALALDNGRIAHFINWPNPSSRFRSRVEASLGEVISLEDPNEVLEAAIASSAIPVLFEPARLRGRDFVDAVAFSMHPLRAALYDDADAALVVVVAPSGAPPAPRPPKNPFEVWGRYLDLANWRDLQQELLALPAAWKGGTLPVPLCIVEPEAALPGGVLAYSPRIATKLMRRGEQDALRALDRAGWLVS